MNMYALSIKDIDGPRVMTDNFNDLVVAISRGDRYLSTENGAILKAAVDRGIAPGKTVVVEATDGVICRIAQVYDTNYYQRRYKRWNWLVNRVIELANELNVHPFKEAPYDPFTTPYTGDSDTFQRAFIDEFFTSHIKVLRQLLDLKKSREQTA